MEHSLDPAIHAAAESFASRLRGRTFAAAESCTAGRIALVCAAADGSGTWFRGGVVAYQSDVKFDVLGVPEGPVVTADAARAMAAGAARLLRADVAVATTGAAGPQGLDGVPPGRVVIGWFVDGESGAEPEQFDGAPGDICAAATLAAFVRLGAVLDAHERIP